MPKPDDDDSFEKAQQKKHQAAVDALSIFATKYAPATLTDADTFFSTNEIVQSIRELTGVSLEASDVFETMLNMNYSYEAMNGLDLNWLLKKD